ncbi:MAG: glycosyltransferase [Candidatus Omnitrophica bacterium]|nr:glycosyltransferase [Candidatus Omnitrophota bacterium]
MLFPGSLKAGERVKKISVVICCYNGERLLGKALDSVMGQTLPAELWEAVFVNDGSTDSSAEIARRYRSYGNFVYYENPVNMGLPESCNRGISLSRGEYIVRVDSDDAVSPDLLSELYAVTEKDRPDLVYTDRIEIDTADGSRKRVSFDDFDLFGLIACGTLMRKDLVAKIGGYREMGWEEYDLYLRYLKESGGNIVYVPEPLYEYYFHGGNMTRKEDWKKKAWQELIEEWGGALLREFGKVPEEYTEAKRSN